MSHFPMLYSFRVLSGAQGCSDVEHSRHKWYRKIDSGDVPELVSSVHTKFTHCGLALDRDEPNAIKFLRSAIKERLESTALINYPCAVCGQPTSQWCSRCQNVWYCSPEHSRVDWAAHRVYCFPAPASSNATYSVNMIATPPPAEPELITVNALYFNPAEERSEVVTVECMPSQKYGTCPIPLLKGYFPAGPPKSHVLKEGLNGESLRFPLHLWYCPDSLQKGAPVNRSIHRITSNFARKQWCGPAIVLKFSGSRRQGYMDAGSNDLPALSAFFINYE
ncbi:hypothetical protein NMY22_g17097 [Coprinellus aureogranulatus]|nr:hypothetical protein NMY22_g17097 [Coprinellus aureogranulatus]